MMKRLALAAGLVLVIAACGEADTAETAAPAADSPTTSAAPATTAPPASEPNHEDEAAHDEEADHADEGTHDDATTDDEESHDDEGDHDDEAGHDEGGIHGEFIPAAEGEPSVELTVVMSDFAFDPATIELAAGQTIRLTLVNEGLLEHELRLSNHHKIEEHLAAGHEDTGHHDDDHPDIVILAQPGETRVVDFTLPDDTGVYTDVACLIPGHYEAGMLGEIVYG